MNASEATWMVHANGVTGGPMSLEQLRAGFDSGQIDPAAQVQRAGSNEWVPISVALGLPAQQTVTQPPTGGSQRPSRAPLFLRDLFRGLDGTPAHVAIVLGLVFVLLSPAITRLHNARAESAAAELQHAQALMDIDFDEFRQTQGQTLEAYKNTAKSAQLRVLAAQASREGLKRVFETKQKKAIELRASIREGYGVQPDPSQVQAFEAAKAEVTAAQAKVDEADAKLRDEQIKEAEAESKALDYEAKNLESSVKALDEKRQSLASSYNIKQLQRAEVDARTASRGATASVHLQWLGRFLLLVGLLVLTLNATGGRQKIGAAMLLLALFAWLTAVRFDFLTGTQVGSGELSGATPVASPSQTPLHPNAPAAKQESLGPDDTRASGR